MADGSLPAPLSIVDGALTLDGWRAVRRKLPPELRRELPITPPAGRRVALALLGDILRKRSQARADEAEPRWRPRLADIAQAYGVDVGTLRDWLHDTAYERERGCLVIRGLTALRMARKVFPGSPPRTIEEAIDMLDADLQRRVLKPKVWRSTAGESTFFHDLEAPKYPELGSGPVTIDQLASILANPDKRSFQQLAAMGEVVRDAVAALQQHGPIDPEWFKTGMGQAFWLSVLAAAEKKSRKKKA